MRQHSHQHQDVYYQSTHCTQQARRKGKRVNFVLVLILSLECGLGTRLVFPRPGMWSGNETSFSQAWNVVWE